MKLTFVGAAHEVTGSCHHVECGGKHVLVDCGMEQGRKLYESPGLDIPASEVDYVVLTHAHIDHSGMLPALVKAGFTGQIFATYATADLCGIMLLDSAHIQEFEATWRNRKAKRQGKEEYKPLYTTDDARQAVTQLVPCPYAETIRLCDEISVRFTDIGHLLGSSSVEMWLTEKGDSDSGGIERKIVFSGDVGNTDQPIIKDPVLTSGADYVVVESTYGNRLHDKEKVDYVSAFANILEKTFRRGGNVVVPSFAVGRTQEMLYFIREIKEQKLLGEMTDFPVYLDSPLAIEATKIFSQNTRDCFDKEALALVDAGVNPLVFDGLHIATSSDESREINFIERPKLIISASGMCDAGRIKHHLKHNLWRSECTVLFVGYQAEGTLGRKLVNGEKTVRLFGEEIQVNAQIETLKGVSGHADMEGLLAWLDGFTSPIRRVFVVHGEDDVTDSFANTVTDRFNVPSYAPYPSAVYDLAADQLVSEGLCQRVEHADKEVHGGAHVVSDEHISDRTRGVRAVSGGRERADQLDRQLDEIHVELVRLLAQTRDWTNADKQKLLNSLRKCVTVHSM